MDLSVITSFFNYQHPFSQECNHEYLNTLGPDVLLHARNQLNMVVSSENASSLQLRSLETTKHNKKG